MTPEEPDPGLRERLSRQGEEALGKLAEDLIANPVVNSALTRALDAREKAVQAQEVAMGALNIPSAADVERLTRRLRSVSQRLEGIEDALDRLETRLMTLDSPPAAAAETSLEARLDEIARDVAALREGSAVPDRPVARPRKRPTARSA